MTEKQPMEVKWQIAAILQKLQDTYRQMHKRRRLFDNEMSREIGISNSSWNTYVNGGGLPSLVNALAINTYMRVVLEDPRYKTLAAIIPNLFNEEDRVTFMDVSGYARFTYIDNQEIIYIASNWGHIDDELRREVYEAVRSAIEGPTVARRRLAKKSTSKGKDNAAAATGDTG